MGSAQRHRGEGSRHEQSAHVRAVEGATSPGATAPLHGPDTVTLTDSVFPRKLARHRLGVHARRRGAHTCSRGDGNLTPLTTAGGVATVATEAPKNLTKDAYTRVHRVP